MNRAVARSMAGLVVLLAVGLAGACATRLYEPPTGPGVPFPESAKVWDTVTSRCRNASRFVAEVRVEGWTGASRERVPSASFHSALTKENDIYLEVPGAGRSWVQMAGRANQSLLLLPRDERFLRATTREIVDALTGLKWDAVDLLNVLTGCVIPAAADVKGLSYGERAAIELGGDARAWVRQVDGVWQLDAATRDGLLIEYRARDGAYPTEIRVSSMASGVTPLQLKFTVSQVQVNIPVPADTFVLAVPPNFVVMTLAELRSNRPAGDGKDGKPSVGRRP